MTFYPEQSLLYSGKRLRPLSQKALADGNEMLDLYGNAPFDWRTEGWGEATVNELLKHDHLRNKDNGLVYRPGQILWNGVQP